jgi:dynein heavy chain, axonemal
LVEAKQSSDPGNMGPLFDWLPQQIWPRVKAIEGLKKYTGRQSATAAVFL